MKRAKAIDPGANACSNCRFWKEETESADEARWGVDTGTLADPSGPQFTDYLEDNPTDWRSGFVVLTYYKGTLLWPEVVHVISQSQVTFRGQVLTV